MHTLCTLFLGVCTPCADFFWVHAHFFQTLKIPPFSPSCTGSFRIPVGLIGLITSPTSLDRNSKVLFSVVLKGLKSLHSLHGVHEVCTGLPPDDGRRRCTRRGRRTVNGDCVPAGAEYTAAEPPAPQDLPGTTGRQEARKPTPTPPILIISYYI
jgi:hypothetical protein